VIGVGWVKVILAGYKLEDDRVFLGFEKCRVTEVEGDESGTRLERIFLELYG